MGCLLAKQTLQGRNCVLLLRDIVLFIVIAVGLGLGSAYVAINNADELDQLRVGPWKSWPEAASPDANPYTKAEQARSGSINVGSGEGIAFEATTDNDGTPLDGACQYQIKGRYLPSRLWTLSLITKDGKLVDNPSSRYSYHSQNIARVAGNSYEIMTGPEVMPGNWLKSETLSSFKLVLRLYETPLTSGGGLGQIDLPDIAWVSCQ